ncbi:helix-turn-helix domain-containing protein [Deminuibacter soli]|uniref:AraC family transcriptional regulator n=1 Tax=Deminuibacter soli TaxID=2291815 RepID=A0A3E1NQE1_9BACT|nr:helix-turn-helix transcriptional regulator [Deminuibacter soli]RFM30141.1 AraC family transcriptional regulator [Deminuibacter soli]
MKLFIKNMVCTRCKMVVRSTLEELDIPFTVVELGMVQMPAELSAESRIKLSASLEKAGLELMDDNRSVLIEKIRLVIIELVYYSEDPLQVNLSVHLSEKLNHNYTYLANLFSSIKGITIEQYFITQKIERVKELIVYDELNLTEIANLLHYSSIGHLSNQFKKVTGLSPSHFRKIKRNNYD